MAAISLPFPVLAIIVGALLCGIAAGAFMLAFAFYDHQDGENLKFGSVLSLGGILLAVAYGVGWAALRFL